MRSPVIWRLLFFATVALTIISAGHYYVALRMVWGPGIEPPWSTLLASAVWLSGILAVAPPFMRKSGLLESKVIAWYRALWMGVFFYLIILLGLSDALIALCGVERKAVARIQALSVLLVTLVLVAAGMRSALKLPAVRRVRIKLARWPKELDGFRIVQISDLHLGPILDSRFAQKVVEQCNRLEADLIAITGDLVDGRVRSVADAVAPMAGLKARHGVFFVTGNHEHYLGAKAWAKEVSGMGMEVLGNRHVAIEKNGAKVYVAGTNDHSSGMLRGPGEDLPGALTGIEADKPVILLAHDPETFGKAFRLGVDLQLSGHTHGGQLWPFEYLVRLRTPFIAGQHTRKNSQLYVSRGTGFWGPPMRVFSPAEITELVISTP